MRAAVGQADHRAGIGNQFRHPVFLYIKQGDDVFGVEMIFHGDIEESVERVFAALSGYLNNRLPFQRFKRGIMHLPHFHQIPVAGENAGAFQFLAPNTQAFAGVPDRDIRALALRQVD